MVTLVMEPLAASVNAPASLVTVPVDVPVTMTVAPAMGEPDCRSTTVPWSNDWAASVAGMISDSRADTTRCMRHDPGSSWTGDSSALAEPDRPSAHGQLLTRVQERWTRCFTRPYPMHYEFRDENVAEGQTEKNRKGSDPVEKQTEKGQTLLHRFYVAAARLRMSSRSCAFCVSAAARRNSSRASSGLPSFASRSPRTAGSR